MRYTWCGTESRTLKIGYCFTHLDMESLNFGNIILVIGVRFRTIAIRTQNDGYAGPSGSSNLLRRRQLADARGLPFGDPCTYKIFSPLFITISQTLWHAFLELCNCILNS